MEVYILYDFVRYFNRLKNVTRGPNRVIALLRFTALYVSAAIRTTSREGKRCGDGLSRASQPPMKAGANCAPAYMMCALRSLSASS